MVGDKFQCPFVECEHEAVSYSGVQFHLNYTEEVSLMFLSTAMEQHIKKLSCLIKGGPKFPKQWALQQISLYQQGTNFDAASVRQYYGQLPRTKSDTELKAQVDAAEVSPQRWRRVIRMEQAPAAESDLTSDPDLQYMIATFAI